MFFLQHDSDDESFLESPYLGRARFKPSSFTSEKVIPSPVQHARLHHVRLPPAEDLSGSISPLLAEPQRAVLSNGVNDVEETLKRRTGELHEVLEVAQALGEQLRATEKQLADAQRELRETEQKNGMVRVFVPCEN